MKKQLLLTVILLINIVSAQSQDVASESAKDLLPQVTIAKNLSVKFGGFVRAEYYIDNREAVGAVDGLFGFFPLNEEFDANGEDQNKVVRQNLSVQSTRFNALLSGPSVFGAKSNAFFEFDFTLLHYCLNLWHVFCNPVKHICNNWHELLCYTCCSTA